MIQLILSSDVRVWQKGRVFISTPSWPLQGEATYFMWDSRPGIELVSLNSTNPAL